MPVAVKSYAWSYQLRAVVAVGETVDVSTPGFANPDKYDTENAQVVHRDVLQPGQYTLAWAEDFSLVTITNQTEVDWQPTDTLYVTVAGKAVATGDIEGEISALDERVSALETSVSTLEATVADHETRIAALESAVLPARVDTVSEDDPAEPPHHERSHKKHR